MATPKQTLIELERKFWESLVKQDTDTAVELLTEPALMVSSHGAMQFDHAGYRNMVEKGSMVIESFELSDMQVVFPDDTTAILTYRVKQQVASREEGTATTQEMNDSSTWIKQGDQWHCVMHTETPAAAGSPAH